jgi:hypothetical protein
MFLGKQSKRYYFRISESVIFFPNSYIYVKQVKMYEFILHYGYKLQYGFADYRKWRTNKPKAL